MRRRLIASAVLAVAAAGYGVLWKYQSDQLAIGFANWVAQRRALGWSVAYGAPARGGSPIAAELAIPDVALADAPPAGLSWHAAHVTLHVDFLHLGRLRIAASGPQRLRLGAMPEIPTTAKDLTAWVPLDADAPEAVVTLHIQELRATLPAGDVAIATADLSADARATAQRHAPWLQFTLAATGIDLPPPPAGAWAFGPHIDTAALAGTLAGPSPPAAADHPPAPYVLAASWRDGGGTLDLHDIALRWGTLDLTAAATLALDAAMQPAGTAALHLANPGAALDTLTEAKLLPPTAAMAIRLLAPQTSPGHTLDLPLALQNRTLALGPVRIARLPELHWPDAP